jgi:MFS family permease
MAKFQYKYYLLSLLTVVAAFNYLDRGVLALAMEPIKQEFQLSDSQLGFMSGFAFALFYAVAGIPIARWADRGNRNHVVTLTTGLWSAMVAISGLVSNFTQLLLVRVGVAVGESGCVPPAQSLISDYFDRAERPHAMAIYWMSAPLSTILAFLGGGWLIEQYGWRMTFIVIGIPGVLLAILVKFTLREPRLKQIANTDTALTASNKTDIKQAPLKVVLQTLLQKPAFRHVVMAFCVAIFFGTGIGVWIPTFFIRSYGMETGELGIWLALTWGFGGVVFTYLGGYLATRYMAKKERLQMRYVAWMVVLCAASHILCYLSTDKMLSLIFVSLVAGGFMPLAMAPAYAAIQSLVEDRMRAVAMAFIFMLSNLIGLGLGPLAVGMVSDALATNFGDESLRYALLLFSPGYLWCAFHNWKAANTIEQEIKAVEVASAAAPVDANTPFGGTAFKSLNAEG